MREDKPKANGTDKDLMHYIRSIPKEDQHYLYESSKRPKAGAEVLSLLQDRAYVSFPWPRVWRFYGPLRLTETMELPKGEAPETVLAGGRAVRGVPMSSADGIFDFALRLGMCDGGYHGAGLLGGKTAYLIAEIMVPADGFIIVGASAN